MLAELRVQGGQRWNLHMKDRSQCTGGSWPQCGLSKRKSDSLEAHSQLGEPDFSLLCWAGLGPVSVLSLGSFYSSELLKNRERAPGSYVILSNVVSPPIHSLSEMPFINTSWIMSLLCLKPHSSFSWLLLKSVRSLTYLLGPQS